MRKNLRIHYGDKKDNSFSRETVVKEVARRTNLTESTVKDLFETGWTFKEDMEGYSWLKSTMYQK